MINRSFFFLSLSEMKAKGKKNFLRVGGRKKKKEEKVQLEKFFPLVYLIKASPAMKREREGKGIFFPYPKDPLFPPKERDEVSDWLLKSGSQARCGT